ncbi:MAG: hypothetical protein ACJA1A_002332 [Saprospiraceae bacterium]|jgi:hypothetical protein
MRLIILFILIPIFSFGQPPLNRYNTDLFSVSETNEITFSSGVPQPNEGGGFYEFITGYPLNVEEYNTSPVDLKMDIFQPTGDTLGMRPLVIICFGGGFLSGSKDHWSIRLLCQNLAKRGYVTAAIDYRLGMNIFDSDLANRAVYRGLQDARSVVRFFRGDADGANIYKIDPNQIFIGGHSSGGFMALHNAYLDKESERPLSTFEWSQDGETIPDQGCIDCVGNNLEYSGHANAVFSLAGALGFTSFIESGSDPSVVMFHSTDDDTVPYDSGEPFSSILWLVVGSDLPDVYGSLPISERADEVGLNYNFFSYTSRGHAVHENGGSALYSDIVPGISDWFFDEELKPKSDVLLGASIVCSAWLQQEYHLEEGNGIYYDWQVTGGSFNTMNNVSTEVDLTWQENNPNYQLSVTPFSKLDAKGEDILLDVTLQNNVVNTFLNQSSDWSDVNNWDLFHAPLACEDIVINPSDAPIDITIANPTEINSLFIGNTVNLLNNSELTINLKNNTDPIYSLNHDGTIINNGSIYIYTTLSSQMTILSESSSVINKGEVRIEQKP